MLHRIFNDLSFPAQRSSRPFEENSAVSPDHPTTLNPTDQISVDPKGPALTENLRTSNQSFANEVSDITHDLELVSVLDSSLQKQTELIIQLRNLASEAATESISATEREAINLEFEQLKEKLDRIDVSQAFDSQSSNILENKINKEAFNKEISGLSQEQVTTPREALSAMDALVRALNKLGSIKEEAGSARARLEKALGNLNIKIENLSAAEPAARDENIVSELTRFTREQILTQSATAMVGQANLIPQGVFELVEEL
ncbi:MAG: hypothetical protein G3M70_16455 [Candidatus Nitronauta litoralis]|uniref:Flagellin C-terminal domain-containing protein n=1 Tax=Candidatus Nitronauta litoralis TaxID=2705533 RepID=A0A7T0BYV9_9BACT|nr:MAG: hypothetical protein G3M70_16455 [Candidatus Nitronauta litoralis]